MSMLVSVIVPVYNVQRYLRACVDSILSQTYDYYEIILVDDGSTDESGKIADELAQSDSRIRVIHQRNGGLSAARNTGLDHAHGDIIQFVDSDDMLETDCLSRCVDCMERMNADCVEFRYRRIDDSGKVFKDGDRRGEFTQEEVLPREQAIHAAVFGKISPFAWSCVTRHKVWEKPAVVRLPQGRFMEDEATKYKVYANANRVALFPRVEYIYRWREGSLIVEANREHTSLARADNVDERFRYFTDDPANSGVVVSASLVDALLERDVEEMLASYYGLLRLGRHRGDSQVTSVRQRLCQMVDVCRDRRVHIGRGGTDADLGAALPHGWHAGSDGTHARPAIGNRQQSIR